VLLYPIPEYFPIGCPPTHMPCDLLEYGPNRNPQSHAIERLFLEDEGIYKRRDSREVGEEGRRLGD